MLYSAEIIAAAYANLGRIDMTLHYYQIHANIDAIAQQGKGQSISNYNIGSTYLTLRNYEKALKYLNIAKEHGKNSDSTWDDLDHNNLNSKIAFAHLGLHHKNEAQKHVNAMILGISPLFDGYMSA